MDKARRRGGSGAGRPGRRSCACLAFSGFLSFAFPAVSYAVFEDNPAGARQAGFGGQAAALDDPLSFYGNPALPGSSRKFETGAHFLSAERTTQGPAEFSSIGVWALVPRLAYGKLGTLSLSGLYRDDGGVLTQKSVCFGWSTWQLSRGGSGVLDLGASFKLMQAAASAGGIPPLARRWTWARSSGPTTGIARGSRY